MHIRILSCAHLCLSNSTSGDDATAADTVAGRHWVLGYFLAWLLLLQRFEQSLPEHRAQLASQLSSLHCVDRMLSVVFSLVVPVTMQQQQYAAALRTFDINGKF